MADDTVEILLRLSSEQAESALASLARQTDTAASGVDTLADHLTGLEDDADSAAGGLDDLADSAENAGKGQGDAAFKTAALTTALGAAVEAIKAAIGAFIEFGGAVIDASNELADANARTDVSVKTLAGLRLALQGSGQAFGEAGEGLNQLGTRIAQAAAGAGEAGAGFRALGVDVVDLNGNVRSTEAVLLDVSEKITDSGTNAAAVGLALGESFGPKLRQALAGSSGGLQGFIDAADALGTGQAVAFTGQLQRGFAAVQEAALGAGASILNTLAGPDGVKSAVDLVIRGIAFFTAAIESNIRIVTNFGSAFVGVFRQIGANIETLLSLIGVTASISDVSFKGIATGIAGFIASTIGFMADLFRQFFELIGTALGGLLGTFARLARIAGLDDFANGLTNIRVRVVQTTAAVGKLASAAFELSQGGFLTLDAGIQAAANLDTSAILATLDAGRGPSGSGGRVELTQESLSLDSKLFVADLTEALKTVQASGDSSLATVLGGDFDLDRFLLELGGAGSDSALRSVIEDAFSAADLSALEQAADGLAAADKAAEALAKSFNETDQHAIAGLLGLGDSSEALSAALTAAALGGSADLVEFLAALQAASDAVQGLSDAQLDATAAFKEAASGLDGAGRALFESSFGVSLGDRQATIDALSKGTAEQRAQAVALTDQTTAQIGEVIGAQAIAGPISTIADGLRSIGSAFNVGFQAFGSLITGDVVGGLNTLASGFAQMAAGIGETGGAIIGTIIGTIVPGIGNVVGAVVGKLVGKLLGEAIGNVATAVAQGVATLTTLGQIGADGVAERLDDFKRDLIAGLDVLPVVLEEVIPPFLKALLKELPPVLREVARELLEGQLRALRAMPIVFVNLFSKVLTGLVERAINALISAINGLFGTNFGGVDLNAPRLLLPRERGQGGGLLDGLRSLTPNGGDRAFAGVGQALRDVVQGSRERIRENFGLNLTINGVVGDRDGLARFLNELFDGDRRFGFSRGS